MRWDRFFFGVGILESLACYHFLNVGSLEWTLAFAISAFLDFGLSDFLADQTGTPSLPPLPNLEEKLEEAPSS